MVLMNIFSSMFVINIGYCIAKACITIHDYFMKFLKIQLFLFVIKPYSLLFIPHCKTSSLKVACVIHVKYVHKIFMPRRNMVPQLFYHVKHFPFSDSCGSYLVASDKTQNISTPNYPHQYSSDLTCVWTITTSKDYLVKLETGFVSNDTCCERLEVSYFGRKVC